MSFYNEYAEEIKATLDHMPWAKLQSVVRILHSAWLKERQVFVMGNGGSASTASHMACDLNKNTAIAGRPRLRVMSLTDNMALFSAHGNDNGYEHVFTEQLITFLQPNDIVVAISASGNSLNVLNAVKLAKERGAFTIGWSGYEGGALSHMADLSIVVPNHIIEQIEDIHLMMEHMVTTGLRRAMLQTVATHAAEIETMQMTVDAASGHKTNGRKNGNARRVSSIRTRGSYPAAGPSSTLPGPTA